jgi:hypothetical protein
MFHILKPALTRVTLIAVLTAAALLAALPSAAHASSPAETAAADAAATYLQARAAAALPGADRTQLRALIAAPFTARHELAMARGAVLVARGLGHSLVDTDCAVRVLSVAVDQAGGLATVVAHAVSHTTWCDRAGQRNLEGEGLDHTLKLALHDGVWLVTGDDYVSDLAPRLLEAGGATSEAAAAVHALEQRAVPLPAPVDADSSAPQATVTDRAKLPSKAIEPFSGYSGTISFDREAARVYADKWALSRNPSYRDFSPSDCANFGSQVMLAGGYPKALGSYTSGWWYDRKNTSATSDDTYSHSWIAVIPQMGYWLGRYADLQSTITGVTKGDYVYYDWSGDGVWDHVAELVGTNSAGQKVIDAHTTDHYRVYWKLGSSSTKYRFVHTRPSIILQ